MGSGVDEGEATRQRVAGVAGVQTAESSLAVKLHCMHSSARCKPGPPVEILAAARDAPGGWPSSIEPCHSQHSLGSECPTVELQNPLCCIIPVERASLQRRASGRFLAVD